MDFRNYATSSGSPSLPIRTRSQSPVLQRNASPLPIDLRPPSPADSGYSSTLTTPKKRPSSSLTGSEDYEAAASYTLDGADHDYPEDPVPDTEKLPRTLVLTPVSEPEPRPSRLQKEERARKRPVCKPRKTIPRPQDTNHIDLLPHRQALNTLLGPYLSRKRCGPLSPSPSSSSIRCPDRFVHPRDPSNQHLTIRDRHRLSKESAKLMQIERIFRNNAVSRDPFVEYPPRSVCPLPTYANDRQREQHRDGQPTQARARTTLDAMPETYPVDDTPTTGSVWSASFEPPIAGSVDNGAGQFVHSQTGVPLFVSEFLRSRSAPVRDDSKHRGRMCAALGYDRAARLLLCNVAPGPEQLRALPHHPLRTAKKTVWNGATWASDIMEDKAKRAAKKTPQRVVQLIKQLTAPGMRDDFYIAPMACCPRTGTLAVALEGSLYTWTEDARKATHINGSRSSAYYLTSLSFSCAEGGHSILAFGRSDGLFGLMALSDGNHAHIVVREEAPISSLSWRPKCTMRPSKHPQHKGQLVPTEDLLVGTESGVAMYYVIEWPSRRQLQVDGWGGDITLAARLIIGKQQVCGLTWSPDGNIFAAGTNDDYCCLFSVKEVFAAGMYSIGDLHPVTMEDVVSGMAFARPRETVPAAPEAYSPYVSFAAEIVETDVSATASSDIRDAFAAAVADNRARRAAEAEMARALSSKYSVARLIQPGDEYCRWAYGGAVKAMAFCPWQDGLVAVGGGLRDQCIHFYHTATGCELATIYVAAQVSGLTWSTTRREIAATFGLTHMHHRTRIAVYSWPECKQVASVIWPTGGRSIASIVCSPCLHTGRWKARAGRKAKRGRQIRTPHPEDIVIDDSDGTTDTDDDDDDDDDDDADTADRAGQAKSPATSASASTLRHVKGSTTPDDDALHDGVVVVASTDNVLNFYEIWPRCARPVTGGFAGVLGGSDILEDMEGVMKEGDIIR